MLRSLGIHPRKGHRRIVQNERLIDIARTQKSEWQEVPVAVREEPTAPSVEQYFEPAETGRARIIIMLTEDGTGIEPLVYTKMTAAQATSNLQRMAMEMADQMILRALAGERREGTLVAEIEFLRGKLTDMQPPPRTEIQPAPFPDAVPLGAQP